MGVIRVKKYYAGQGGGAFGRAAAPDLLWWLLRNIKVVIFVRNDNHNQRAGHGQLPRTFQCRKYLAILLNYKLTCISVAIGQQSPWLGWLLPLYWSDRPKHKAASLPQTAGLRTSDRNGSKQDQCLFDGH